jgi:hypothetical protein
MHGNISPPHHRFYGAVFMLLRSFGYATVVFGTIVCVPPFVREPLKGFSRNLVVESFIKPGGHLPVLADGYNNGCCVKIGNFQTEPVEKNGTRFMVNTRVT